jgi:hypothetical protein
MINEALAPLVKRIEALENIVKNVPLSQSFISLKLKYKML